MTKGVRVVSKKKYVDRHNIQNVYDDYLYIVKGHKEDENRCIVYSVEPILEASSKKVSRHNFKVIGVHVNIVDSDGSEDESCL